MMIGWMKKQVQIDDDPTKWIVEDYSCDDESWFLHLRSDDAIQKILNLSCHRVRECES